MTFLLLTLTSWDEPPRARHQVARALSAHGDVVMVARNRTGAPGLAFREVEAGITLAEPSWPLDYRYRYRLPLVNEAYQVWLLGRLKRRYPGATVITFDHTAALLRRYFPDYVYFCNDELIGNSKVRFGLADAYHRRTEAAVARHAGGVAATSLHLVEKLSRFNPNTHEILLGAPVVTDEQLASLSPRPRRDGPNIGLVGYLGRRIPEGLLHRLADLDGASLTLVGPVDPGTFESLTARGNVRATGVLTGDALIREVHGFDVAIAPYDLGVINKGVTPNKLWLYLACGRPAVVTRLPNMASWTFPDGCVFSAGDEDAFVELVQRAFAEDGPELEARRIAVARENTWDHRVEQLLSLLPRPRRGSGGETA